MVLESIRQFYSDMYQAEKRVADYILANPEKTVQISMAQLSQETGTSDATVLRMCRRIGFKGFTQLKLGLAGGRNSFVKPEIHGFLIGIDVENTWVRMMIMTEEYKEIARRQIFLSDDPVCETVTERILQTLREMFREADVKNPKVLAVAMGLPGAVDRGRSQTIWLPKLHWDGVNPVEAIAEYFDAPFVLDNNANVRALGEYAFGSDDNPDNMVLITLESGVGSGIIIDGKIYGGAGNIGAEFGHQIVNAYDGAVCLCGKRGHLEAYCSESALRRDVRAMLDSGVSTKLRVYYKENDSRYSGELLLRAIREEDEIALKIMERYIHFLAIGIANLMTVQNPGRIVISGGLSEAGDVFYQTLEKEVREMIAIPQAVCEIRPAMLGRENGVFGACRLAGEIAALGEESQ